MNSYRGHSAKSRPYLCPDCDGPLDDHRHEPVRPQPPKLPAPSPGSLLYEELPEAPQIRDSKPSERIQPVEKNALSTRLRSIEDEQLRLRGEMNQFHQDTVKDIKLLASSVLGLRQKKISLEDSLTLSLAIVQSAVEETHRQMLQSSDLLGKQVLDLRRDLDSVFKMPHPVPTSNKPHSIPVVRMSNPLPVVRMSNSLPVVKMPNPIPVPHRSPVRKPEQPPIRKY